jgi:anti-sigma-K factor RskA
MASARSSHVDELAPAYALDALDPDERRLVEAHLGGCHACAVAVERARRVAALLPLAAEQREPPMGHEARFLARIAAERRTNVWSPIRQLVPLAAAAVIVLGFGTWNLRLQQELAGQREIVRVFSQADARELSPSSVSGDARGRAFLDRSTDQILVSVSGLAELPADQAYQLWFTRPDGVLESGGTFRVGEGGNGLILATAPAGLHAYSGVGISAGSRTSSERMVMYWGLSDDAPSTD